MKKILLLLIALSMFITSCSKDDDSKEQTFFVNVYSSWQNSEEKLVNKALVYIFPYENKTIDNSKSAKSVANDGLITYTDGSLSSRPKYATRFQTGVFNIENISNGEYILWVVYMEDYGGRCHSSYKKINVNSDYRGTSEKKFFQTSSQDQGLYLFQNW